MRTGRRWAAGLAALCSLLVAAPGAAADPATSISYPMGSTNTRFTGRAFDTCAAPTAAAMNAWLASPYRGVGVYVSGASRTCAQTNLTASWVAATTRAGWRLIPIHKGLQPSCGARPTDPKISLTPSTAVTQGRAAADEAIGRGSTLGMIPGSAYYLDIEDYARNNTACRVSVLSFISGWTRQLHARGYLAGVYMNLNLGAADLAGSYTSAAYARPDALWIARYDGSTSLTGWVGVPNSYWAVHQRGKQYLGGHDETYGGTRINIDSDYFDGPVASVRYPYRVTSTVLLNVRTAPTTTARPVRGAAPGSTLSVICQAPGSAVGGSSVWDRLSDGTWVADRYVSTPSNTTYSPPLPRCGYGYQVDTAGAVNVRTGPGTQYAVAGSIPNGGLAAVTCQALGTLTNGTRVWNKLETGRWVADYFVANPSNTGFSGPAPRC